MEKIETTAIQALTNSSELLNVDAQKNSNSEVSLYGKGKVSAKTFALAVVDLKQAFPELETGFFDVLERMLDAEGFTDERLTDAVKTLIKTCVYPRPQIANLLGYDKQIKCSTWNELAEISKDYSAQLRQEFWKQYTAVNIEGQARYVQNEYARFFKIFETTQRKERTMTANLFKLCECGKTIVWLKTEKGKFAPVVFKELAEEYRERIERFNEGKVVELPAFNVKTMKSHFADCPFADKFRKPKQ